MNALPLDLDELSAVHFERFCGELLDIVPQVRAAALRTRSDLAWNAPPAPSEPQPELRELSPEALLPLELPLASTRDDELLVARVLRDL